MSSDRTSELFWLEYGKQIKNKVPGAGQDGRIFFLVNEAQKGPPAGTYIPNEYTAKGLYDLGNSLLATDNIYYSPSALHGFDQAVGNYLNWVDLICRLYDATLLSAIDQQEGAQTALEREKGKALSRWERDTQMGLATHPFPIWVDTGRAPALSAAYQSADAIAQTIIQIQLEQNGPMSPAVKQDKDALGLALNASIDYDGYNMHVAAGDVLTSAELILNQQNGERVRPPSYYRVPLYDAPNYKTFVQSAMEKSSSSDYNPSQSIRVTIDAGKDPSDYNFGQTRSRASIGASIGWFSFSASRKHFQESSTLQTGSETSQVSIKVTYENLEAITITTVKWCITAILAINRTLVELFLTFQRVADVSKYRLRSDAPKKVQAHGFTWDKVSRIFKVIPNYGSNCVTVIGVIGEPFGRQF
ncbi:hypothetical protein NW767_007817 [Fusarium falciforme]|nr:hypothetical protein NW767_007817 [Fusarium falciforme]